MTGHKICSEVIKLSQICTKKHHYIPDSSDKGACDKSPENGQAKLHWYFEWQLSASNRSPFLSKKGAVCHVLLDWQASQGLRKTCSWQVPQSLYLQPMALPSPCCSAGLQVSCQLHQVQGFSGTQGALGRYLRRQNYLPLLNRFKNKNTEVFRTTHIT